ncbi:Arc family DNA-binding protein [Allofournierella sp.]|uniref:Arc family DNA-binding protein n=1 Tax=Allofournierella sp. TaxID=1940256 RepID=UPI003AB6C9D0
MATDKVQTTIRVQETLWKKITHVAGRNHRSFNAQVEYLIEQCVEGYERENGPIPVEDGAG